MAYDPTEEEFHIEGARSQSITTYRQLLAERDGKLAAARATIGPGSDRWQRAETKLTKAEADVRAIYAKLNRLTDGIRISHWWFYISAVVFAALEAPLNKFMLDNIIRGSNFDSYALSLFVTFFVALACTPGRTTTPAGPRRI